MEKHLRSKHSRKHTCIPSSAREFGIVGNEEPGEGHHSNDGIKIVHRQDDKCELEERPSHGQQIEDNRAEPEWGQAHLPNLASPPPQVKREYTRDGVPHPLITETRRKILMNRRREARRRTPKVENCDALTVFATIPSTMMAPSKQITITTKSKLPENTEQCEHFFHEYRFWQ
mgnify:CR=1 FL=1